MSKAHEVQEPVVRVDEIVRGAINERRKKAIITDYYLMISIFANEQMQEYTLLHRKRFPSPNLGEELVTNRQYIYTKTL